MTVRFASFNMENLFARPKTLNQMTWAEGRPILDAFAEFNSRSAEDKAAPRSSARRDL